jgi:hypothetical protein
VFAEAVALLWDESTDPRRWRSKSRGSVLGFLHQLKREAWEQQTRGCAERSGDGDADGVCDETDA